MKLVSTLVVATGLFAALPAVAAPITLNFEDQTSFASLNLAPSSGLTANGALLALANDGGGLGSNGEYFSNNPSGSLVMFATTPLPGERAAIAASAGFIDWVSFYYSSQTGGTVSVLDAAGNVLTSSALAPNSTNPSSPFNVWTFLNLTFAGVAYSMDFSDTVGSAAFDDVTVNAVPVPAALLLLPFGLAAVRLATRKR